MCKFHYCAYCNKKFKCDENKKDCRLCYCVQLIGCNSLIFYCSNECERLENETTEEYTQ